MTFDPEAAGETLTPIRACAVTKDGSYHGNSTAYLPVLDNQAKYCLSHQKISFLC